jgi:hypothetical protein
MLPPQIVTRFSFQTAFIFFECGKKAVKFLKSRQTVRYIYVFIRVSQILLVMFLADAKMSTEHGLAARVVGRNTY